MKVRQVLCLSLTAICLTVLAATVRGQDAGPAPEESVPSYHYDFETIDEARNLPPADEWGQVVGRNHPEDIRWKLDETVKHSGKRSFLMELDGIPNVYQTQTSCRLDPRFRYRLSGWIRTEGVSSEGLRKTYARLEVLGLKKPDGGVVYRARTAGVTGTTDWTEVSLELPRDLRRPFRYMRVRCIIDGLSIDGKVWFDDIRLEPKPSLLVEVGRVPGFLTPSEPKIVKLRMNTVAVGDYRMLLSLSSPAGRQVMSKSIEVRRQDAPAELQLPLPMDVFGVYRLHAKLTLSGRPVVESDRAILYWPGGPEQVSGNDFGLALGSLVEVNDRTRQLLVAGGFGTATFDALAWEKEVIGGKGYEKLLGAQLGRFREHHIEPVAVFSHVPDNLTADLIKGRQIVGESEIFWPRILSLEPSQWSGPVKGAATLLGDRVACWQVGALPSTDVPADVLTHGLEQFRSVLMPLTFRRHVGVVFDGTERVESLTVAGKCDFIVLRLADVTDGPDRLPSMVRRLKAPNRDVWVELSMPVSPDSQPPEPAKLLENAIYARVAGADRVIFGPLRNGLLDIHGDPTSLMSAAGTAARQLNGLAFQGRLQTHSRTLLFTGADTARLAVIPTGVGDDDRIYLGPRPLHVDLDGNARPLPVRDGRATLPNRGTIYFVDNVDPGVLLTRMSVKVTPGAAGQTAFFAQSRPQTLQVEVTNHFDTPMIGSVDVETPPGWRTRASTKPMRLETGGTLRLKSRFSITSTEETGERLVRVRLSLGDKLMVVTRKVLLAPRDVDTQVRILTSNEGLVSVLQKITNNDSRPIRLALFVSSPEKGRLQQFTPAINPGGSTEARFNLGKTKPSNLWIGWRELSGSRFFNKYTKPE